MLKDRIEKILTNGSLDDKDMLEQLKGVLDESELRLNPVRASAPIASQAANILRELKEPLQAINSVKTGFTDFDTLFGGFYPGEMVIVGGRPSMGKTQLLINLALNMASQTPILYFSFDMSISMLTKRFISSVSGISANQIIQNTLTPDELVEVERAVSTMETQQIYLNDTRNSSFRAFKEECQKQILEKGVGVIMIDSLQMMTTGSQRKNREHELSYITRELKNIAKDFNVCVVASSQLTRWLEYRPGDKRPHLYDLRECSALENEAAKIMLLYRPEYYNITEDEEGNLTVGLAELSIVKNTNGVLGRIKLMRDDSFTNFRNFDGFNNQFRFSENRLKEIQEF
jgi:replicative DNA helicase